VLASCEIVYVTDDTDRFGFAYGTLPSHPERGEEAFHVERSADGEVTFGVIAFSRPADLFGRVGGPVARAVQNGVTNAYLEGVRRYVASAITAPTRGSFLSIRENGGERLVCWQIEAP
jgi:uncharacterized protein (UPF0548 family)